ncbi:MAG TPA: HlyD family efflux transporter periplasmic adaptor subunit [Anaerolineales bacterium]|nr:HlyD family efflux transporter periplasmic adaptor subunit [Anaerolineales bacterium]
MIQKGILGITLLLGIVLLVSCNGLGSNETPTPEAEQSAEEFTPVVSATGVLVPAQFATLSMTTAGVVDEVLAREDEQVASGQGLVRLEGKEELEAGITAAQFELANAQQALNALKEDTELAAAQALQTVEDKQAALEDLLDPDPQQAAALQAIADAKKAVDSAERRVRILKSTANESDINAAKAQVVLARDVYEKAKEDYEPYANKPEDNLVRANLLARLSEAQKAYEAAVRNLNALQGTANEVDIGVAEAELARARAALSQAEREWERVKEGPSQAKVSVLEAQIAEAQSDHETYQQGADPGDLAVAEARLANAQRQLSAAQAALDDLVLTAPFDGSIGEVSIHTGEWVNPGQPVMMLADLGHMLVETTDLNEIDVARVKIGHKAIVTFDALPEVVVNGAVTRIAPKAAEGSGVNYTVTVELDEIPSELRWGMTAFVDIEVGD